MVTLSYFQTSKLPVITNNLKHLFIENQLLVVYLRIMKVIWVSHIRRHYLTTSFRSHYLTNYFATFRFTLATPYFI